MPLWKAELEIINATHADIGAYLLGLWGLPAPVVEAVAFHHQPQRSGTDQFTPLVAVHVATAWASQTESADDCILEIDPQFLEMVGAAGRVEHWEEALGLLAPVNQ